MTTGKQVFSTISTNGQLELSIVDIETPTPGADDVVVRIEAAPINPSDMGPLFGPASMDQASMDQASMDGTGDGAKLVAPVPENRMGMVAARLGQTLPVGNECAGTVVATGDSPAAQALDGKLVSIMPGAAYAQFACVPAATCLVHNDTTSPQRAASSFVNPLTALCFLETMRMENHKAIVHTAAASNLGQMLVRLCQVEDVPLVNIVRTQEQADILTGLGAKYVCNSSDNDFMGKLTEILVETGATLGFDAIGGGKMGSDILTAMERAASRNASGLNTYGSSQLKQVYLYGSLDFSPTTLNRAYGMAWSIGGWLMPMLLARIGGERTGELRQRVADEINTIFASDYTAELSLQEMISPEAIARYLPKKTGEKYLVAPQKGL
ncbi:MAG: NADH oxidase [Rhizobiales bacterium TMED143]|nr:NADH oxidase [Rhodobiaceae bacterium]OUV93500.1 MAG: NADH oxidase [Rhizobiales bacterium TMED143]